MKMIISSLLTLLAVTACSTDNTSTAPSSVWPDTSQFPVRSVDYQVFTHPGDAPAGFPDFITTNEDYFITKINNTYFVDSASYLLRITGLVDHPCSLTYTQLCSLTQYEMPLTVECIGNNPTSPLLSTAIWTGFNVYDLLRSLGLQSGAKSITYRAVDGYFATHSIGQLKNNLILGALQMNGVTIPEQQGFPLRILNPGFYGVKQPGWVISMEVSSDTLEPSSDYWGVRGWDVGQEMEIDCHVFFPVGTKTSFGDPVTRGFRYVHDSMDPLTIGGAAYGGTRVDHVEYSADTGATWTQIPIVMEMDLDNVWKFWKFEQTFAEPGTTTLCIRATDIYGNTQVAADTNNRDGQNPWKWFQVIVPDSL